MKLHIVAPSTTTTAVSLEDFDRAALGSKLGMQFGPETVMLTNNTDRTIVAARIIWIAPHPLTGKPHKTALNTDVFQNPGMTPIATPHSHTVVGPSVVLAADSAKGYQGTVGASPQPGRFAGAGDVTVTLDAVMFEDGEVVGPDTRHLAEDTAARKTALAMLLAKVRKEGGTRQTLLSVLGGSQFTPASAQDVRVANALRDLAQQGMALVPEPGEVNLPPGKRLASVEQWLLALPQPPTPFKKQ